MGPDWNEIKCSIVDQYPTNQSQVQFPNPPFDRHASPSSFVQDPLARHYCVRSSSHRPLTPEIVQFIEIIIRYHRLTTVIIGYVCMVDRQKVRCQELGKEKTAARIVFSVWQKRMTGMECIIFSFLLRKKNTRITRLVMIYTINLCVD